MYTGGGTRLADGETLAGWGAVALSAQLANGFFSVLFCRGASLLDILCFLD